MKSRFLIVAACLLSVAPAQVIPPNEQSPRAGCGTIAGEGCSGLAGGALLGYVGVGVGGIIGLAFSHDIADITWEGLVLMGTGAVAGISLGTATGTWAVGRARHQNGRWGPTFLGAFAGTAVGASVAYFGYRVDSPLGLPLLLIGALMPATGAAVGYNLSRPRPETGGSFLNRLDYPSFALLPRGRNLTSSSLDVRLLSMRL